MDDRARSTPPGKTALGDGTPGITPPEHAPPERVASALGEARAWFEQESARLRPELHRFCARMAGSVTDGEDILQEVLAHAFYKLGELEQGASLRAWLFRIAHNRSIDWLRRQRRFVAWDEEQVLSEPGAGAASDALEEALSARQVTGRLLVELLAVLPPRERACVVLDDVLGYSLEETAALTGSTVGAVKAALHRGRSKLARARDLPAPRPSQQDAELVRRYIERFNQHDWTGVRELLTEDARLELVGRDSGRLDRYFTNYAALGWRWKLALGEVDGEPALVHLREVEGQWRPHSVVQLFTASGRIGVVRDYVHVDYLLADAEVDLTTVAV
jgi:RNA polymerase sigma-70 factor (ECF subfamily)